MKFSAIPVSEASLVRSICRESFFAFVQEFWSVVVPEKPVWNWHIPYICDLFQQDAERVFRNEPKTHDTIVNIPPGTTKSTILSIMAPAWGHAMLPTSRFLAASHTQQLTFELSRKSRMVERSELYRAAFPEVQPSTDQDTKALTMNTVGGGRLAATVGGMSPMGFHAHFIIVDDPLDPQQAMSDLDIQTANNFMSEVLPTRKVNKEITPTWLIMQRLHQNDPTGYLLNKSKESTRHICLPAEESEYVKPDHLHARYQANNGLLDPTRLPKTVLQEAIVDLGEYGFAGQYRQHPVPRGGGMFKAGRIEIGEAPHPDNGGWLRRIRFWDKAGTTSGGAYTVGLLMGRFRPKNTGKSGFDGSQDQWWILDVVRGQWDAGAREEVIMQTAAIDGPNVEIGVEQEPGSGGKESAQATVRRLAGYRVHVLPAVGTKEERADTWAVLVNQRCFYMRKAPWNKDLLDELSYFPFSTYKDQVDAGSGAFALCAQVKRVVGAF